MPPTTSAAGRRATTRPGQALGWQGGEHDRQQVNSLAEAVLAHLRHPGSPRCPDQSPRARHANPDGPVLLKLRGSAKCCVRAGHDAAPRAPGIGICTLLSLGLQACDQRQCSTLHSAVAIGVLGLHGLGYWMRTTCADGAGGATYPPGWCNHRGVLRGRGPGWVASTAGRG
jgi:hypothetical protein